MWYCFPNSWLKSFQHHKEGVPHLRPHYHTITRTKAVPVHVPVPIPAPPAQVITHVENVPIHDPPAIIKVPERGPTHVATWQRLDCWPCRWFPMMSDVMVQELCSSLECFEVRFLKISMDASLHSVFSNCSVSSCSSSASGEPLRPRETLCPSACCQSTSISPCASPCSSARPWPGTGRVFCSKTSNGERLSGKELVSLSHKRWTSITRNLHTHCKDSHGMNDHTLAIYLINNVLSFEYHFSAWLALLSNSVLSVMTAVRSHVLNALFSQVIKVPSPLPPQTIVKNKVCRSATVSLMSIKYHQNLMAWQQDFLVAGGPQISSKLVVLHKPMTGVSEFGEKNRLGTNHVEPSYLENNGWVASYAWTLESESDGFFQSFSLGFPQMKHPLPRMVKVFPGLRCSTRPDTLPWNTSMTALQASATGSLALWDIHLIFLSILGWFQMVSINMRMSQNGGAPKSSI